MLSPNWGQVKLGPLLRGERDPRWYLDCFHPDQDDIKGIRKFWITLISRKLHEPSDRLHVPVPTQIINNGLICFRGQANFFEGLSERRTLIKESLQNIVMPKLLKRVESLPEIPIALHVRRGDFVTPFRNSELFTRGGVRTPSIWFTRCLSEVRRALGHKAPAFVFSDGSDLELDEILSCENTIRIDTSSAIGDLIALSRARVLIASGGSSFSAWASFLGEMPTITHPGQSLAWFKLRHANSTYVGEFDPTSPNREFLNQVRQI